MNVLIVLFIAIVYFNRNIVRTKITPRMPKRLVKLSNKVDYYVTPSIRKDKPKQNPVTDSHHKSESRKVRRFILMWRELTKKIKK